MLSCRLPGAPSRDDRGSFLTAIYLPEAERLMREAGADAVVLYDGSGRALGGVIAGTRWRYRHDWKRDPADPTA